MKQLPDNSPIVTVNWIATRLGITPGRVRRYIEKPDGPPPTQPALKNHINGLGEYAWMRADAEAWMEAYKSAPKRGRRGDGSKQRKVTQRMRQIVSWMRENDGYIMCSESGETINEIEVLSVRTEGDNIISKTFGTITEKTLERLCNAELIQETDRPIHTRKNGRIIETATYYGLKV